MNSCLLFRSRILNRRYFTVRRSFSFGLLFFVCATFLLFRLKRRSMDMKLTSSLEIVQVTPYGPLYYFDTKYLDSEVIRSLNTTSEVGQFMNKSSDMVPSKFHRQVLHELFLAFDDLWRLKHKLQYILFGGAMLGAYRHAGRIPHDDDIDLLVDEKYMKTFYNYLNGSNLTAVNVGKMRKVFFRNLALSEETRLGRYPSIDIVFYHLVENGTRMLAYDQPMNQSTKHYFPISYMPFEGRLIPAPRCVHPVLEEEYKKDYETKCCNHWYSHRLEERRPTWRRGCIKCHHLYGLIPFTTWVRVNATHRQQLVLPPRLTKEDTVSWNFGLILPMPDCS